MPGVCGKDSVAGIGVKIILSTPKAPFIPPQFQNINVGWLVGC